MVPTPLRIGGEIGSVEMQRCRSRRFRRLVLATLPFALTLGGGKAAWGTLWWDVNGAAGGAGGATPTGTWGVDNFWSNNTAGNVATGSWTAGDTAVFSAGSDATGAFDVAVSGTQDIAGLTFEDGTPTINGGTLQLSTSATADVGSDVIGTINSIISGGFGLTKVNAGMLLLGGFNTYSGGTTISAGTLRVNDSSAAGPSAVTVAGGTLEIPELSLPNNISLQNGSVLRGPEGSLFGMGGTASGVVTVQSDAQVTLASGDDVTDWLTVGDAGGDLVSGNAVSAITVTGSGRVHLPYANPGYSGSWVINSAHTYSGLLVSADAALGVGTNPVLVNSGALELTDGAILNRAISLNNGATLRSIGSVLGVSHVAASTGVHTVGVGAAITFTTQSPNDVLEVGAMAGGTGGSSITVNGAGTVRLKGASTYSGSWTVASGILDFGTDARLGSGANVTLGGGLFPGTISFAGVGSSVRSYFANGGNIDIGHVNSMLTISGGLTSGANGGFTKTGEGVLRIFSVQTHGANSKLNVNAGHFRLLEHNQDFLQSLQVFNGALADFTPAGTGVLQVRSLFIGGSGKLDLTSNKLIIKNAADFIGTWNGTAYTNFVGLVQSGRNGGAWNGGGIVTSSASADLTGLGIATAQQAGRAGGTFGGVSVSAADLLIMYTYAGDANLDGKINIDDYGRIDGNVASSGSVFGWFNGDFNYDGKINIDDYGIIDGNINRQGSPFGTAGVPGPEGMVAVPEPAGMALLGLFPVLAALRRVGQQART